MRYALIVACLFLGGCIGLADQDRRRMDELTSEVRVLNSRLRESDETLRKLTTALEAFSFGKKVQK